MFSLIKPIERGAHFSTVLSGFGYEVLVRASTFGKRTKFGVPHPTQSCHRPVLPSTTRMVAPMGGKLSNSLRKTSSGSRRPKSGMVVRPGWNSSTVWREDLKKAQETDVLDKGYGRNGNWLDCSKRLVKKSPGVEQDLQQVVMTRCTESMPCHRAKYFFLAARLSWLHLFGWLGWWKGWCLRFDHRGHSVDEVGERPSLRVFKAVQRFFYGEETSIFSGSFLKMATSSSSESTGKTGSSLSPLRQQLHQWCSRQRFSSGNSLSLGFAMEVARKKSTRQGSGNV